MVAKICRRLHRRIGGTVSVPTCHACGKSHTAAGIVLWLLVCWSPCTVLTTAPVWRQVEEVLWREIRRLVAQAPVPFGATPNLTQYELGDKALAVGLSTNDPNKFQGFHAPLLVCLLDEAAGIPTAIYQAVAGVTTGHADLVLEFGNPTNPESEFCRRVVQPGPTVDVVHVSAFEVAAWNAQQPAPIPGLVSHRWIEEQRRVYGEDSAFWTARVLGQVPEEGADTLIRLAWIEAANRLWEDDQHQCEMYAAAEGLSVESVWRSRECPEVVLGVDLARHGGDRIAWAIRQGTDIAYVESWEGTDDLDKVYQHTKSLIALWGVGQTYLDATGLLAHGMIDLGFAKDKIAATSVNFGSGATVENRFVNRRSELWWELREWLRAGAGSLPPSEELLRDLLSPRYTLTKTGERFDLESKEAMRKRAASQGLPFTSPDLGDAVALALIGWRGAGAEPIPVGRAADRIGIVRRGTRLSEMA